MIKQGATQPQTFSLPTGVLASDVTAYRVVYSQYGTVILTIQGSTIATSSLEITLTQAQTLTLYPGIFVDIEVIILTDTKCYRSNIITDRVERTLLNSEVAS